MSDAAETSLVLNVLRFEVGVNMGDHAETVVRAQVVDLTETVEAMVTRLLCRDIHDWGTKTNHFEPQSDWKLEIRLAEVPAPTSPPSETEGF